jgi:ubiquinone/menaquinone biosynthesis C-methylase UbiE
MKKKIIFVLLLAVIIVKAQNMSVFLRANASGWYPYFLEPVVSEVLQTPNAMHVLDIGTGPGKLPELLHKADNNLILKGIDIDTAYIDHAKKHIQNKHVSFDYQQTNAPLAFQDASFDVVTFCSVLFLLDEPTKQLLMQEAIRVLKPNGKLIVLTPSGKKSPLSAWIEVWKYPFSQHNWTFIIWKTLTTKRGREWQKKEWLQKYAQQHGLSYAIQRVFNENATLEILIKKS